MTVLADFLMDMTKPLSKANSGRKGSSWFRDPFHHCGEDMASGWSYCTYIQGLEERNEGWCLAHFLFLFKLGPTYHFLLRKAQKSLQKKGENDFKRQR